ncbi:MAG: Tetratricopeptide 2 repeat protein [Bryobacterales bacterium]|jgi:cytochrome c-type biogenesis protein CcmH/NrfG|nr:Tetratricopeptide 2 repeat protein [Bryobacterales bacterium]
MFMRGFLAGVVFSVVLFAAGQPSYEQALSLYNKTDYPGALAVLKTLPQDPRNLELMGRCYLMDADYKKAVDVLEKAVQLDPNDSMRWTWLGRAYGRRAETSFALNALPLANKTREAFERAVKLDPKNSEAVNDLFEFYIEAPGMVGGGHDKARNLLPVISKNSTAEAAFASARLAEASKEHRKAEEQLREAVARAPKEVGRLIDLAGFFARHGRFEESDKTFTEAERLAPEEPKVIFARAEALIKANRDLKTARELLQKYLTMPLTPDDPPRSEAQKLLRKAQGA